MFNNQTIKWNLMTLMYKWRVQNNFKLKSVFKNKYTNKRLHVLKLVAPIYMLHTFQDLKKIHKNQDLAPLLSDSKAFLLNRIMCCKTILKNMTKTNMQEGYSVIKNAKIQFLKIIINSPELRTWGKQLVSLNNSLQLYLVNWIMTFSPKLIV